MSGIISSSIFQWAASLGQLQDVQEEKLASLLAECEIDEEEDPENLITTCQLFEKALVLSKFFEHVDGQQAEPAMRQLVLLLGRISSSLSFADTTPQETELIMRELMVSVQRTLYRDGGIPDNWKQLLSAALGDILIQLFKGLPHIAPGDAMVGDQANEGSIVVGTSGHLLLRVLGERTMLLSSPILPVLPGDALAILEWLCQNLLLKVGPVGTVIVAARFEDEESLVLIIRLALTVTDGPGSEGRSTFMEEPVQEVLAALANWAIDAVRYALGQLLETTSGIRPNNPLLATTSSVRPVGAVTRAASRLAACCLQGLVEAVTGRGATASDALVEQLLVVTGLLADLVEACTSVVIGRQTEDFASNKILDNAAAMLEDCGSLLAAGGALDISVAGMYGRFKSVLLIVAALIEKAGGLGDALWKNTPSESLSWDITRSLLGSTVTPGSCSFWGAQHLGLAVAEALVQGACTAWPSGQDAVLVGMLLEPGLGVHPMEQLIIAMTLGRLCIANAGLPPPPSMAGSGTVARSTRHILPMMIHMLVTQNPPIDPKILPNLLHTITVVGSVCGAMGDQWAYDQVLNMLSNLYREPKGVLSSMLMHEAGSAKYPGLLAEALLTFARNMKNGSRQMRADLRERLLIIFTEMGLRTGPRDEAKAGLVQDLGALLPAIAAASDALDPNTAAVLAEQTHHGPPVLEIQGNARIVKLLSFFWLHVAQHRFASPHDQRWPQEWRDALGVIAVTTPVLWMGGSGLSDDVILERLRYELTDRLKATGVVEDAPTLKSTIGNPNYTWMLDDLSLLLRSNIRHHQIEAPYQAGRQANLLIIATAELARCRLCPLPGPGEASPLTVLLAYCQMSDVQSQDSPWFTALAEAAMIAYLKRLWNLRRPTILSTDSQQTQMANTKGIANKQQHGKGGNAAIQLHADVDSDVSSQPAVMTCLEGLAITLISQFSFRPGYGSGRESAETEKVITEANALLKRLLEVEPGLYWNRACIAALLDLLEVEEGENMLGSLLSMAKAVKPPRARLAVIPASQEKNIKVWGYVKAWIAKAATIAPRRTEAVLHSFLGRVAAVGGGSGGVNFAVMQRASDLMALCMREERIDTELPASSQGILALCHKQAYSGANNAAALLLGNEPDSEPAASSVLAMRLVNLLTVATSGPQSALESVYLQGAALLASASPSVACSECWQLLKGICELPSRRLQPDVLSLCLFAWSWITSSQPGWTVGLASRLCTAWKWTVNRRMGLYSNWRPETQDAVIPKDVVDGILAHSMWLMYFSEMLKTFGDVKDEDQAAVSQVLSAMLHHSLRDANLLFPYAVAVAPRFRLLLLAMRYARYVTSVIPAGTAPPETLILLYDRILRAALMWFASQPSYYGAINVRQAEEQVAALQEFQAVLSSLPSWYVRMPDPDTVQDTMPDTMPLAQSTERPSPAPMTTMTIGRPRPITMLYKYIKAKKEAADEPAQPNAGEPMASDVANLPSAMKHVSDPGNEKPRMSTAGGTEAKQHVSFQTLDQAESVSGPNMSREAEQEAAGPNTLMNVLLCGLMTRMAPTTLQGSASMVSAGQAHSTSTGALVRTVMGDSLRDEGHPVWGMAKPNIGDCVWLLGILMDTEIERMQTWLSPRSGTSQAKVLNRHDWSRLVHTAFNVSVALACHLPERLQLTKAALKMLRNLVIENCCEKEVQAIPEAASHIANFWTVRRVPAAVHTLHTWAPQSLLQGLSMLKHPHLNANSNVRSYAVRCMATAKPDEIAFVLPQLIQLLREEFDWDKMIQNFLLKTAAVNQVFAHRLIWALQTEEKPPEEAFNPEIKRSGWTPPRDVGLWESAGELKQKAISMLTGRSAELWAGESTYFESITNISGMLKKLSPGERRTRIRDELMDIKLTRNDLYVPTNPDCRIISHIASSGTPMQSAAKVPILVAFKVEQARPEPLPPASKTMACIFKVGDDCRQDVLALQVVQILRDAWKASGLDLYVCPYGVLPTSYEKGIVEVVPNTRSRAALGELSDRGLYDIFQAEFGAPGSPAFEAARSAFIHSEAGYAVASYILQAKDRHNGNLLIDSEGHIVHIDFGFILETSPGGNMGFETAAFKLSHEMAQLLDPGLQRNSAYFLQFEELVIRGFLAARVVAEQIISTVALMVDSGLPCFSRGRPIPHLRERFHLELNDCQAAAFMRQLIRQAYQKWTTGFYDYIQQLQNKIPY